jgi:hypothetical protein
MKVVIRGKVYDAESEPVMIIFNNDKERLSVCKDISEMAAKDGERGYVMYPETGDHNIQDLEKHLNVKKITSVKM